MYCPHSNGECKWACNVSSGACKFSEILHAPLEIWLVETLATYSVYFQKKEGLGA